MSKSINIRDMQRISAQTIVHLNGPTPVKSGDHTIAALFPLKPTDPKKLKAALLRAEALAKNRDVEADNAALEQFGPVDRTDWSFAAVKPTRQRAKRRK